MVIILKKAEKQSLLIMQGCSQNTDTGLPNNTENTEKTGDSYNPLSKRIKFFNRRNRTRDNWGKNKGYGVCMQRKT